MAATQTIAAPLKFSGSTKPGATDPAEFLQDAEARMKGQNLNTEKKKLEFVVGTLTGSAFEWYTGVSLRKDFKPTYTYFKSKFAESWGLPGQSLHSFSHTKVEKQFIHESPAMYYGRVVTYLRTAIPVANFDNISSTYEEETRRDQPAATDAQIAYHKEKAQKERTEGVQTLHTHLAKYWWTRGLISPYSDVVKGVDPNKDVDDMVDHVQREGFRRLNRDNFKFLEDAMKAYRQSNGNGVATQKKPAAKVHEVDADDDEEEVAAARTGNGNGNGNKNKNKQCTYCNRFGHVVRNCKTKARDNKRQQSNSSNDSKANNGPNNVNASKAVNDSQHLVNNLLNPKSVNAVDYTDHASYVRALEQRLAQYEATKSPSGF